MNNLEDQALRKRKKAIETLSVVIEELEANEKEAKLSKTVSQVPEMKPRADLYYARGKLYEVAEQFIESVDDLERAFELKPYVEAAVSNYTFYERVTGFMLKYGIDF